MRSLRRQSKTSKASVTYCDFIEVCITLGKEKHPSDKLMVSSVFAPPNGLSYNTNLKQVSFASFASENLIVLDLLALNNLEFA